MSTRQIRSGKKSGQGTSSTCRSIGRCRDDGRRRQGPCVGYAHQRFLHKETLMQLLEVEGMKLKKMR